MKIFMATMGLDIGGAETHIVELAKQLQAQGHQVIIASAGGAYVPEIESVGIRHKQVPMKRRKLSDMLQAKGKLQQIIQEEKPDMVHAHARIPAFLCGLLHRKMKFPFVTTAHWVFRTGGLLGYLTNWGQRVIAVSEDIKTYLMEEYAYPAQHISITINGIDTEKFSPKHQGQPVLDELNLDPTKPILCYVSRMDTDRALVAEQLITIAPDLCKEIPDLTMVLVGGGNVFDKLQAQAKAVNQSLGRTVIHMTGPRTDINNLVAVGQVFVGVSRSALEAMAAEKVVIVAGNEGYQGLFQASCLEEAVSGNFCCRGLPPSTESQLKQDLLSAFALSQDEKKSLGSYCRQVILQHYSVERMAADTMAMYQDLLKPSYKVLMSGYYGFDNAGDDAILQAIHQQVQAQAENIEITVLSNNPKETTQRYGVKAIPRFHLWKITKEIRQCDGLISGGGSLLQDRTSTRSILYYLWVIMMGQRLHKPVMLYANGIGPVIKSANRRRVAKAVEQATTVSLRDKDSAQELRAMGVKRSDLTVTADPVQGLTPASPEEGKALLEKAGIQREFVTISVREWGNMGEFTTELAKFCDHLHNHHGLEILFVLMQPARDLSVSQEVQKKMTAPSCILQESVQPHQLMSVLGQAKLSVAMRLHTLIFSARMGVPLLGLVYDPKVASYLNEVQMPSGGDVTEFSSEKAKITVDDLLKNHETHRVNLEIQRKNLEKQAEENHRLLLEMLHNHKGKS